MQEQQVLSASEADSIFKMTLAVTSGDAPIAGWAHRASVHLADGDCNDVVPSNVYCVLLIVVTCCYLLLIVLNCF